MGKKLYSFVHFEAVVPSTIYMLELEQDPQNGNLKVIQQMVSGFAPALASKLDHMHCMQHDTVSHALHARQHGFRRPACSFPDAWPCMRSGSHHQNCRMLGLCCAEVNC